jgi:hypothetical protein
MTEMEEQELRVFIDIVSQYFERQTGRLPEIGSPYLGEANALPIYDFTGVIGISGENEKVVADFLKKQKEMEYVVACNGGKTAAAYGVNGIPHAFVIVDGKVVWNGHPMNGLDKAVEDAIKTLKPADAKKDAPAKK